MPRYDVPKPAPEPLRLVQRFVNTIDTERDEEWLATAADLEQWLAETGRKVDATSADLRRARELRDALRALLTANNAGVGYPADACTVLDAIVVRARLTPHFEPDGSVAVAPRSTGVNAALGDLVGIVVTAILDGSFGRLKACQNCRWAFYDYSPNRGASWCSMSICGNRIKTRRYRARKTGRAAARAAET